jgi:tRNA U34 2-thiouridine synthase MnmA/TrmU
VLQPTSKRRDGRPPEALCLLSGGLDSALAAKLVQEQGIRVTGVHFLLPFGRYCKREAHLPVDAVAESLGIDVEVVELGEEYLEIVRHPKHGYGSNVNPCIDCHIFMLRKAGQMMESRGMNFVVTGEVVGQRPMSQRSPTMRRIEKESGLEGYLVRPLSAQLLEPTRPELEGLLDRDALLGVHGRSRKELLRLAHEKGVRGFSSPGGGCLLTDPGYARRVRDLMEHNMLTLHNIDLLSVGRHFRLPAGGKLVVGRNESDNDLLSDLAGEEDVLLTTPEIPGPTAVLTPSVVSGDDMMAARIVARYSDAPRNGKVRIRIGDAEDARLIEVSPLDPESTSGLMI